MKRFIEDEERSQITLLPECLDDYIAEHNRVQVVDVFVGELKLRRLGFGGTDPAATGRPSYHPAVVLKIYIYGYLKQAQSSRRLECEAQRNVELMWLTCRLAPDFKTITDFRKDHGDAIRKVCREFVLLCRRLKPYRPSSPTPRTVTCKSIDLSFATPIERPVPVNRHGALSVEVSSQRP